MPTELVVVARSPTSLPGRRYVPVRYVQLRVFGHAVRATACLAQTDKARKVWIERNWNCVCKVWMKMEMSLLT